MVRQFVFGDDVLDGLVVEDGTLDVLAHHHCLCLAVQFVGVENLGVEVIHHDFSLCLDSLRVALHGLTYLLLCFFVVIFRIFLDAFNDLVVALVGGIVGQHVKNKAFLDGLLHTVKVERIELALLPSLAVYIFPSESLQGLSFWGGSEGKIRAVGAHLAFLHQFLYQLVGVGSTRVGILL